MRNSLYILCSLWATLVLLTKANQEYDGSVEEGKQSVEDDDYDDDDYFDGGDYSIEHEVTRLDFEDHMEDYLESDEDLEELLEQHEEEEEDRKVTPKFNAPPYKSLKKWKNGWMKHPLYVIILGGFRWDHLEAHKKNLTSFRYMANHGTTIPLVQPSFPAEDYPVWTSLATGLYPEEHGIVGDFMYDLKWKRMFNRSNYETTRMANWWKHAEPFWSTAAKYGKKIAFYNWHDCKLPGATLEEPKDCRPYVSTGSSLPSSNKIAREFNEAFSKLYKKEYDIAVVYTDLLRRVSEVHGPKSPMLYKALHDIDDILQAKLTDIRSKQERAGLRMNLLVLSDYGMTDTTQTEDVILEDYVNATDVQYVIYNSGYASISPYAVHHENILNDCRDMPGVDVYLTKRVQDPPIWGARRVPEELHYGEGEWTQDILIVAQPAYQLVSFEDDDKFISVSRLPDDKLKAGAGFNAIPDVVHYPEIEKTTVLTQEVNDSIKDYEVYHQFKKDMLTQAYAMGPDFKSNYVLRTPVETVDFYQLICFLMQIPAGKHHGDWKRISGMLNISGASSLTCQTVLIYLTVALMTVLLTNRHTH